MGWAGDPTGPVGAGQRGGWPLRSLGASLSRAGHCCRIVPLNTQASFGSAMESDDDDSAR